MARPVFLSFVAEDLNSVNLLRGQACNSRNELEFRDYSVKEPFDSTNAAYIRSQIRPMINNCSVLLCVNGADTYRSQWVKWEIEVAGNSGKGLVLLNLSTAQYFPGILNDYKYYTTNWNIAGICQAIEDAAKSAGY